MPGTVIGYSGVIQTVTIGATGGNDAGYGAGGGGFTGDGPKGGGHGGCGIGGGGGSDE